jgi:hypothetical protein
LTFLPLSAGSVVIGRHLAAAEAFLFGGIAVCFSELGHPAKMPFTLWVISRPKMGRWSKVARFWKALDLLYKTHTMSSNNRGP